MTFASSSASLGDFSAFASSSVFFFFELFLLIGQNLDLLREILGDRHELLGFLLEVLHVLTNFDELLAKVSRLLNEVVYFDSQTIALGFRLLHLAKGVGVLLLGIDDLALGRRPRGFRVGQKTVLPLNIGLLRRNLADQRGDLVLEDGDSVGVALILGLIGGYLSLKSRDGRLVAGDGRLVFARCRLPAGPFRLDPLAGRHFGGVLLASGFRYGPRLIGYPFLDLIEVPEFFVIDSIGDGGEGRGGEENETENRLTTQHGTLHTSPNRGRD